MNNTFFLIFISIFIFINSAIAESKDVLYVGDSQSEAHKGLGDLMYKFLQNYPESCGEGAQKENKNSMDFHAIGGSSYHSWLGQAKGWICKRKVRRQFYGSASQQIQNVDCSKGKNRIKTLLEKKPDLFVFQLHGNSQSQSKKNIEKQVEEFISHLPEDTDCVLMTSAPYVSTNNKNLLRLKVQGYIIEALKRSEKGKKCHVIQGYTKKSYRDIATQSRHYSDGMHLNKRGAALFFNQFVKPQFCKLPLWKEKLKSEVLPNESSPVTNGEENSL